MDGEGSRTASRTVSGSSSHSMSHRSGDAARNGQHHSLSTASSMMTGASSPATGAQSLGSGWQVWGPRSKRNVSAPSVDLPHGQGDNAFRTGVADAWAQPRSTSGSWEGSPNRVQFSTLDSQSQGYSRQQALGMPASRVEDQANSKPSQYSPQQLDSQPGYGVDDLSAALRGMAVADDMTARQHALNSQATTDAIAAQNRAAAASLGVNGSFGPYAQDYSSFYTSAPAVPVESYGYRYGTAAPGPEAVLSYNPVAATAAVAGVNVAPGASAVCGEPTVSAGQWVLKDYSNQPGMFYDYTASPRPTAAHAHPASPFYYAGAPPPMMWNAVQSPIVTPRMPTAVPATLTEKKRELQYNLQQSTQSNAQNLLYGGMRTSPVPHQIYPTLDYSSQVPLLLHGGPGYGLSNGAQTQAFQQAYGARGGRRHEEPHSNHRSAALEEFRTNKNRKWELRDIFGYVNEFSGDQHGSRFIQQKLETATAEERQTVFDEIVPAHALSLSQDVFGNYVVQKLFDYSSPAQQSALANTLEGHILPLSLQMYGCRVVQKALEHIREDQQAVFVVELEPHIMRCVKDANGNHVVQKLIERVSYANAGFVRTFHGCVFELASHPFGCRVLQRCFEHLQADQTRPLLDELHQYTNNLMQDQFGNYVVQFILENGSQTDRNQIIAKLQGQLLHMARHKFASNVCEKALAAADSATRARLIEEIVDSKQDGLSPIVTMMKDQFANYVLQRAVIVAEGEQQDLLISRIRPHLVSMRRYSNAYTKHLIAIERLLDRCERQRQPSGAVEPVSTA